ncbi:MAG: DnaJ C-terminal domain-containing protein [Planctomycetota bacterium]|jgi:DnaJ-class molecular chaperone
MGKSHRKRDYYEVLGVGRTATADEIRRAYRRLARRHHPDVSTSPDAAERFAEIGEAYAVLSDDEKRTAYDRFGHAGVGPAPGAAGPTGAGWGDFRSRADVSDIGSIFEEMFGGRGGRGSPFGGGPGAGPRPAPPRAGEDVAHQVTVSFLTAARGGAERVRLATGRGASQAIDVRIPPGIEPGAKLRVKGKGHPSVTGGPPGDLILTVQVGGHPYFRREGLDLLVDLPVTVAEAAFGATVAVPLLDGSANVKVPAGASSGQKLRLKGKGVADGTGRQGDFYAIIQIVAPDPMSDRVRDLLGELAGELKNPRDSTPWADDARGS